MGKGLLWRPRGTETAAGTRTALPPEDVPLLFHFPLTTTHPLLSPPGRGPSCFLVHLAGGKHLASAASLSLPQITWPLLLDQLFAIPRSGLPHLPPEDIWQHQGPWLSHILDGMGVLLYPVSIRGRDAAEHPPAMQAAQPPGPGVTSQMAGKPHAGLGGGIIHLSFSYIFNLFADPKFSIKMLKSFTLKKIHLALLSFSSYWSLYSFIARFWGSVFICLRFLLLPQCTV